MPLLLLNGGTGGTGSANLSFAPATLEALGSLQIRAAVNLSFAPAQLAARASFVPAESNESRAYRVAPESRRIAVAEENRYIAAHVETAVEA